MTSRLAELNAAGQAVWLDFIERDFIASGGLAKLIDEDALTGVTSNPSIFEKALAGRAVDDGDATTSAIYENEAIADIRSAADLLRPVYDRLGARDGYVSLEVSPYAANNTEVTISEAHRLWGLVDRPNLMVKVPGTPAGVPAIRELIEDGLNINVTLLFSIDAYEKVAEAYLAGLEARVARGSRSPASPASPASSSAASTRRSTRPSTSGSVTTMLRAIGSRRCAARWRSPMPSWPTRASSPPRPRRAGRRWRPRVRRRSGCYGPRPAPRTRPIPTRSTSIA
jgi:hypothetical protein